MSSRTKSLPVNATVGWLNHLLLFVCRIDNNSIPSCFQADWGQSGTMAQAGGGRSSSGRPMGVRKRLPIPRLVRRLGADRRGVAALLTAFSAPVLLMAVAMGVEATSWSATRVKLQRIADTAALAGAIQYAATSDAQKASINAASLAEINGVSGATSRTWDNTNLKLTDNLITVQVVAGPKIASEKAIQVTVKQNVAKTFSLIVPSSSTSVTVSAVAVAEVASLGTQPCVLALGGGVDGITTGDDISVGGSASLSTTGCTLRSNDGISQSGAGSINVTSVYAGGTISAGVCCDLHPNAGQLADPHATDTVLQNALNLLVSGTGTAVSVKSNASATISPGTYASWDVKGALTLEAGLYIVNGIISTGAQGSITGTGVTIITSGALGMVGGSALNLVAAKTSPAPTAGAIAGVVLAGTSSASMSFLGNSSSTVTGLVYLPKASLKFGGTSDTAGTGCTEVIASTVTLTGSTSLAANCKDYGLLPFGSLPGPASVALVQ